ARFLGRPDPAAAVELLITLGPGGANACALAYRVWMTDRGLSAGTVARRLVALRSACKAARRVGRITWGLDVPGPRPETYRDTRGPGAAGWPALLDAAKAAAATGTPKGLRDLADVRLEESTVAVLGKGKTERTRLTLPEPTRAALAAWIAVRGPHPGPL